MNERMKQLIADMETKRAMAKTFMAEGESKDVDKAIALLDEADSLEKEFDAEKRLADLQKEEVSRKTAVQKDEPSDVTKAFLEGVRTRFKDFDGQREGSDADGGYIVPKDVVTQINHFKGTEFSLLPYVDYQRVTTNIGSRTYESKATATSFDELDEAGTITQIENLKFQPLTYRIKNYGGFLPVSNQLLQDTDAALQQTIAKWFARKSVATANNLILGQLASGEATDLVNLDGIKKALNVTLGQAYKSSSIILTNDDGLDWLDTLKDGNDRYILQPNPSDPAKMQIRAGASIVPLLIAPNSVLKTSEGKIPFIIGDLYEAIVFWSREQAFLNASNVASVGGVNAWAQNLTYFRTSVQCSSVEHPFDRRNNIGCMRRSSPHRIGAERLHGAYRKDEDRDGSRDGDLERLPEGQAVGQHGLQGCRAGSSAADDRDLHRLPLPRIARHAVRGGWIS